MATGFFGKLPVSGDFVARGLPTGSRPVLDRWLVRHLAPLARRPDIWPGHGLRGLIAFADHGLALLVLPSHDAAGRAFPLAAITGANGAGQSGIDDWADQALSALQAAMQGGLDADHLFVLLARLPPPRPGTPLAPPLLWGGSLPPQAPDACVAALAGA